MALERESEVYHRMLPDLLSRGLAGKFALIIGERLIGTYDTHSDALRAGYEHTLTEPFLVKQITADEKPQHFSRSITPCRS